MDFSNGGQRLYAMVGPNGEEHWGIVTFSNIQPLERYDAEDSFCDSNGTINQDLPVSNSKNLFTDLSESTRVVIVSTYASESHLKQVIEMGMTEGLKMVFENLDGVLEGMN